VELSWLDAWYRNQETYPTTESDLAFVAEKTRKVLGVPLVSIRLPDVGYRTSAVPGPIERLVPVVESRIREALPQLVTPGLFKVIDGELSKGGEPGLQGLFFARISGPVRGKSMDFGWLVVGYDRELALPTQQLVLAVARHLGALAALREVESGIAQRDQFLSIASHELKTPLTSIYGILQLQERMLRPKPGAATPPSPEQERQHSFFKIVIRQVERLNELIDGLLDVSRIHNGRFMVEPSEVEASAILKETVETRLQILAREAGVKINIDAPERLSCWVDPVRFEEVVTNLGMNAIRFSPEGGMVWMKLREEGGHVILSVRDQGPAIPESDRNRIFKPFERAQRTSRLGGLGLGLFISRQIAQLHGGDVLLVESVPGRGNLFEARFPVRRAQQIPA
jgi:signal transduction histidine kinase